MPRWDMEMQKDAGNFQHLIEGATDPDINNCFAEDIEHMYFQQNKNQYSIR